MPKESNAKIPLYRVVMDALTERIRSGAFSFDEPLCTEASLTAEFGASRITVRRALDELETEGLILRKRGSGCFVSRTAYEALHRGNEDSPAHAQPQAEVYALALPAALPHEAIQAVFDGANEVFTANEQITVIYLTSDAADKRPGILLSRFAGMDIAGVMLMQDTPYALQPELDRLLLQGKSVVLAGCPAVFPHISSIGFDEQNAASQLIDHLISLGHRRIGFFSEPGTSGRRAAEYMLALAQHGIAPAAELIGSLSDADALRRCIKAGATAIIAENAYVLERAARDCMAIGVHIPGSMSLCCMEACAPLPPLRRGESPRAVTCIQFDYAELGRACAQLLLEYRAKPIQAAQSILLPGRLIAGDSTAEPNVR